MENMCSILSCLFYITVLFSAVKTSPNIDHRIIGGQDAHAGQFRHAAFITIQTATSRFFCGGSLIDTQWVLTSGHCIYNGVLFTIQLGSNNRTTEDPNREILASSEYVLHPDFNPETIQNDIGLIKLRMPVTLTNYIQTIALPTEPAFTHLTVTVIGWGQTSDSNPELSETLRYVFATAIPNHECQYYYGDQIVDTMACVIGPFNEGTCTGDNGGGLIEASGIRSYLVGVASFISGNGCESIEPSGYTRTFPYVEWLDSVMYSRVK